MYYIKARQTKKRRLLSVLILTLIFAAAFAAVEIPLERIMADTARTQARIKAASAVNDAVLTVLEEENGGYGDFVKLRYNGDKVSSVTADTVQVNSFKSKLAQAVEKSLDKNFSTMSVPLGTLLKIRMLTGRGPEIKIRLKLCGEVETKLSATFISVGINQTRHRITCSVTAKVAVIMPGCTVYETVTSEYLIAETVIVGEIPGSYTNVNGDDSGIVGQIFDYADID